MALRLHHLRGLVVTLALVSAFGVAGAQAQPPTPAPTPTPQQPPSTDDAPAAEPADAPRVPPRPNARRRPAAPASPAPHSEPDAEPRPAPDTPPGEPESRAVDAGVVPPREAATDLPDGGVVEPRNVPQGPADLVAETIDAGVPALEVADAGLPDASAAPAVVVAEDAGPAVPPDAAVPPPPVAVVAPTTTFVQLPAPFVPPTEASDPWAGLREVIPGIPTGGVGPLGLLALLALLGLVSMGLERLRARLMRDGWLPALLSFTQVCVRLVALLFALLLVVRVVPADVRWVVYFSLMASGAALGWSMRDVLPDLIAGVVIVFERRIRRGVFLRTEHFSGAVERVGLRSSWLRDSKGHRVAVPNRMLLQNAVLSDEAGDTVHEVVLRLGGKGNAADIRRALRDAVLASPWTSPHAELQVLRDPMDPELWQVRGRLLSARFASAFQGQLLERAEAHLAALTERVERGREVPPGDDQGPASTPTGKQPKLDKSEKPDKTEKTERTPKTP